MKSSLASLFAFAFALLQVVLAQSASAAPRPWAGNFPVTGNVTIPAGQSVILDTNVALGELTINGQLTCADRNLNIKANAIMVHGLLQCGTPTAPFNRRLDIALTGNDPSKDVMGMGTKVLGAMGSGRIVLHGQDRKGWTRLGATVNRGATKITLKKALPWRAGDRIVIVSTDYRAEHAEERAIASISGKSITLSEPLDYQHWCGTSTFDGKSIEECAEVGLLTRNILIRGDNSSANSGFGGHVMIMKGASAQISGVQFLYMGQKGRVARYPIHWHLAGAVPGQYLKDSSIVHSYNRFVTLHGTHRARLAGNVAYDTIGHGFYLEDGIERGNVIEDNLGVLVRNSTDGTPTPSDREASVYWISNPDNTIRRNVAAGSEHTGFWLGFPEHPIGLSSTSKVWPRNTPLKLFDLNVSHSNNARGMYVDGAENPDRTTSTTWYEPRQVPSDPNSPKVPPVFSNFTAYKNRYEGIWMRGFSRPVIQSPRFANNWMGAYFASLSGDPGIIQDGLVVGETPNKGNPESWETKGVGGRELPHHWAPGDSIRGLQFYDGPMSIRRTTFANFVPNGQRRSGAISNLSPNPFWISSANTSSDISFVNANKVWLNVLKPRNDGDAFGVIRDIDGSITGTPNRRIVPRNPVLYTSSCTLKAAWNAYICPHNYVQLQIFTYGGVDLTGTILRRSDGAEHTLGSEPSYPTVLHMVVLENRPHSLKLPFQVPKRITFQRSEGAGKAARLSLPYPASAFTVTLWGSKVQKAASLESLSSGGTKYFYDAAAQRLHLRLVSPDGNWQEFEVNRP